MIHSPQFRAYAAAFVTILIWSGVMLSMRYAAISDISPTEIGILRLLPGAVFFAPIWLKFGLKPRSVSWSHAAMVALGAGVGFTGFLAYGTQFAPAADAGVLGPGALPLYVALTAAIFLGERFSSLRLVGFALILAGVLILGGWKALFESDGTVWIGHLLITGAVLSWAAYTIAFKLSKISAKDSVAIITLWGTLVFGAAALIMGDDFSGVGLNDILLILVIQGVLAGVIAAYTYAYAMIHLGASRTAAFGALVPVLVGLGSWLLLGETLSAGTMLGIAIVTIGMLLASGVMAQRQSRDSAA